MVLALKDKKRRSARISMPRGGGSGTADGDPISSLIIKKPKKSGRKQTSRKTRTKLRKPKYLSLRLQFSATERSPESSEMPSSTMSTTTSCTASDKDSGSKQLNLFPLHPENVVEEKEAHDENMAYLFSVADGGASTLTGLLESATNTSSSDQREDVNKNKNYNDSSGTTKLSPSASLTYTYARGRREDPEEVALVRTALRNKEREPSEERWVRYSEVVERRDDQEVSSCAAPDMRRRSQRLSLKLDYEEILSAWSDKGSLFIHAYDAAPPQSPQTVPDIHDDFLVSSQISNETIRRHGWGNNNEGSTWRVPELPVIQGNYQQAGRLPLVKVIKEEEVLEEEVLEEEGVAAAGGGEDQWKMMGQREASVKRYKEKRQNRLFSKRIRYQVRKINAEKRPRLKGRFVKRS